MGSPLCARKRDFRGSSISDFFNNIYAKHTTGIDVEQTFLVAVAAGQLAAPFARQGHRLAGIQPSGIPCPAQEAIFRSEKRWPPDRGMRFARGSFRGLDLMADETKRYDASITNKRRWFGRFPFKQVRCPELQYVAPSFDLNQRFYQPPLLLCPTF